MGWNLKQEECPERSPVQVVVCHSVVSRSEDTCLAEELKEEDSMMLAISILVAQVVDLVADSAVVLQAIRQSILPSCTKFLVSTRMPTKRQSKRHIENYASSIIPTKAEMNKNSKKSARRTKYCPIRKSETFTTSMV